MSADPLQAKQYKRTIGEYTTNSNVADDSKGVSAYFFRKILNKV